MDGPAARRLWPADAGRLYRRVAEKRFLKWMGPWGPRVRKFDGAFSPEGCGLLWGHSVARVQRVQKVRPSFGRLVHRVVVSPSRAMSVIVPPGRQSPFHHWRGPLFAPRGSVSRGFRGAGAPLQTAFPCHHGKRWEASFRCAATSCHKWGARQ